MRGKCWPLCLDGVSKELLYLTRRGDNYSENFRDALNVMEKNGLISSTLIWLDMRDVRNRIVHDYLPEQLKLLYDCIMNQFFAELSHTERQIKAVHLA